MAIDSTELTFVRCPHCRSLVPAMSKVCRMCGEALDGAAKTEDPDKKSGRIRQRTMSRPQDELNAAAARLRAEQGGNAGGAEAPPAALEASAEAESAPGEDPLGAYIQEVAQEEAAQAAPAAPEPVIEPPTAIVSATEEPPAVKTPEPVAAAPEASDEKRRVVVESGRKPGKPGGLNFGRREEPDRAPERETRENGSGERPPVQENRERNRPPQQQPQQGGHDRNRDRGDDRREGREERREDRREERREDRREERRDERREDRREERREERREARPAPAPTSEPRKVEGQSNRLFGWLVSYANPDGTAIELREGKFFVTGSNLKGNDLVIEDSSISTPHALVSIAAGGGLRVQDLMSDRGVFVRKRDGDTYQRTSDTVQVSHGDWLRFGDVEYLVSLIAHVGEK